MIPSRFAASALLWGALVFPLCGALPLEGIQVLPNKQQGALELRFQGAEPVEVKVEEGPQQVSVTLPGDKLVKAQDLWSLPRQSFDPAIPKVTQVSVARNPLKLVLSFDRPVVTTVRDQATRAPVLVVLKAMAVASPPSTAQDKPSQAPAPLAFPLVASIIGVIGGVFMLSWLLGKKNQSGSKTLEVIPVTDSKAIHVVESQGKVVLLEVENDQQKVISQVTDPNLIAYLKSSQGSLKGSAFLAQYLKRIGDDDAKAKVAEAKPVVEEAEPQPEVQEKKEQLVERLEKAADRLDVVETKEPAADNLPVLSAESRVIEPVTQALQAVVDRQKRKMEAIREAKRQQELERQRVEGLLSRKKEVEEKIQQIQEALSRIDYDTARNQSTIEASLLAMSNELSQLEEELGRIMTDAGVLKYLLQGEETQVKTDTPLDSIVHSVRTIEKQRRQIQAIRQTREQAENERRRVVVLLIRKNELEDSIEEIKTVIRQIEEANRAILDMDPNAVTEPIPVVALNELRRLEFELNTILADPGVARKLAELPDEVENPPLLR